MSESASNETASYLSRYHHGVDERRRIQIPSKWRPATEESEFTLMLWKDNGEAGACLRVFPEERIKALMADVRALPTSDPMAGVMRRNFAKNSEAVAMDKQGRICLPEGMAAAAGLASGQPVVLAGAVDWFEIWNPERHKIVDARDEAMRSESLEGRGI